jgi:hypothetical protein
LVPDFRPEQLFVIRDGSIRLYEGDLLALLGGQPHHTRGEVRLSVDRGASLEVEIAGSDDWMAEAYAGVLDLTVVLPAAVALDPPDPSEPTNLLSPPADRSKSWFVLDPLVNNLRGGDLAEATAIYLPVFGLLPGDTRLIVDGGYPLSLRDWNLRIVRVTDRDTVDSELTQVLVAEPRSVPIKPETFEALADELFLLLSFMSAREVGVGLAAAVNADGRVVWVNWGSPRYRHGRSAIQWCPESAAGEVLQSLVNGYESLTDDPALLAATGRAINLLLAADSSEVLDVRVPVASSALELLAWAVLQREGWISSATLRRNELSSSALLRLLLRWAEIPTGIPAGFKALQERLRGSGMPGSEGPEIVVNVRNRLMHPPRRLDTPEWPTSDELLEAWQLVTWYLTLVLLRLLKYGGEYGSRLHLSRSVWDTEFVPWASSSA